MCGHDRGISGETWDGISAAVDLRHASTGEAGPSAGWDLRGGDEWATWYCQRKSPMLPGHAGGHETITRLTKGKDSGDIPHADIS
jgi:hypothetical protein